MPTLNNEIEKLSLMQAAKYLRAYLECSDEIQAGIREMMEILNDPDTDDDDRDMTLITLADALFPSGADDHGADLGKAEGFEASGSEEIRTINKEMDKEEEAFATRLRKQMETQKITQKQLARKIGIGQPAISNMLKRQCRPQRNTVIRLADALEISPEDLWPGITADYS